MPSHYCACANEQMSENLNFELCRHDSSPNHCVPPCTRSPNGSDEYTEDAGFDMRVEWAKRPAHFEFMVVNGLVFVRIKEIESFYNLLLMFFAQFSPLSTASLVR